MTTTISDEPLHSHHIFIFPFRWNLKGSADADFEAQTNLGRVRRCLGDTPFCKELGSNWSRFKFNWEEAYNEAVYFHPHVREVLFDRGDKTPTSTLQYDLKPDNFTYQIAIKKDGGIKTFNLQLEELTLSLYDSGIGFVGYHLNNYDYQDRDEVLLINDYGRRVFPQFLGSNNDVSAPKFSFLADAIRILHGDQVLIEDDFTSIPERLKSADLSVTQFLLPDFILKILPDRLLGGGGIELQPLLDDRMHVICWVGDKNWLDEYKIEDKISQKAAEYWYSLVFVDGSIKSGIANATMRDALNRDHTYKRWLDKDLYYGVSRYSFVVLADKDNWFHRNVILKHLQTMYFQVALLCLLQRGSIVRFSEEITRLSSRSAGSGRLSRHSNEVQALYGKYLRFVNQVYFREVTPQVQGIELYQLMQQHMEIPREVKELQEEIHDFFSLLGLKASQRQADAMDTLSIIGAGLLVPSLILAYFGVSSWPTSDGTTAGTGTAAFQQIHWIALAGMLVGLIGAWAWIRVRERAGGWRWLVGLLAVAAVCWVFVWAVSLGR